MEDPWFLYKRAFHYALEGDEFLCKATLHELAEADDREGTVLQDIAAAAELLAAWSYQVFGETVVPWP